MLAAERSASNESLAASDRPEAAAEEQKEEEQELPNVMFAREEAERRQTILSLFRAFDLKKNWKCLLAHRR